MANRCLEEGWVRIGLYDIPERRSMWVRYTSEVIEICAGREGDDAYTKIDSSNSAFVGLSDVIGTAVFARDQLIGDLASRFIKAPWNEGAIASTVWHDASVLTADLQRAVASAIRCRCAPIHDHGDGAYFTADACPFAIADGSPNAWPRRLAGSMHLAASLRDVRDVRDLVPDLSAVGGVAAVVST